MREWGFEYGIPMGALERWADRVYTETDVGRSLAISIGGVVGLLFYLSTRDWVVAAFATIIVFPLVRLISSVVAQRFRTREERQSKKSQAKNLYELLSPAEQEVVAAFATAGGCVITWAHMNSLALSGPAVESLRQRELLTTSVTTDGMRETFVLDQDLFDIAVRNAKHAALGKDQAQVK